MNACKKDDIISPDNSANILINSKWKITYFNDSGKDETAHFNRYSFTLNSNKTITATNGTATINGTWVPAITMGLPNWI
jgi:hypothetical protein